jgi:hypothetical protein
MKFAQRHCEEERSDDAAIQRAPAGAPKEEALFCWRASRTGWLRRHSRSKNGVASLAYAAQ